VRASKMNSAKTTTEFKAVMRKRPNINSGLGPRY
jgi:hypothetical protein